MTSLKKTKGQSLAANTQLVVGTAAWSIPKVAAQFFPNEGSHLENYAKTLSGVEINSSFYKEHKPATYKRWSESVGANFKFSVKLSKVFTHTQKLLVTAEEVKTVLDGVRELGPKWEVLLVQLPPSLSFHDSTAYRFFEILRKHFSGMIAFEPRHKTWIEKPALLLQEQFRLTKVFADPEPCPLPQDQDLNFRHGCYFRLHGSPEIYKSNYEPTFLSTVFQQVQTRSTAHKPAWCIFDNTTFGYATLNALQMQKLSRQEQRPFVLSRPVLDSSHA